MSEMKRGPLIIASAGRKGGAGKTITAVNLAGALVERGRHVLIVDLDPQASLTRLLFHRDATRLQGVGERILEPSHGISDLIRTVYDGLDLLPGDRSIDAAALSLVHNPAGLLRLRKLLATQTGYHYIILDTPPALGFALNAALLAASLVILPTAVTQVDLAALADTFATRDELADFGPAQHATIVPNRIKHDAQDTVGVNQLRAHYGELVGPVVPDAVAIKRSLNLMHWQPVVTSEPRSQAAAAYRALAQCVEEAPCA